MPSAFSLPARLCVSYTPVQELHQQGTLIVHGGLDLIESQEARNEEMRITHGPLDGMLSRTPKTER